MACMAAGARGKAAKSAALQVAATADDASGSLVAAGPSGLASSGHTNLQSLQPELPVCSGSSTSSSSELSAASDAMHVSPGGACLLPQFSLSASTSTGARLRPELPAEASPSGSGRPHEGAGSSAPGPSGDRLPWASRASRVCPVGVTRGEIRRTPTAVGLRRTTDWVAAAVATAGAAVGTAVWLVVLRTAFLATKRFFSCTPGTCGGGGVLDKTCSRMSLPTVTGSGSSCSLAQSDSSATAAPAQS